MSFEMIYFWLIAAVLLAGADLLLGTVYLLILGASALAAFIVALSGASFLIQLLSFSVFGIVGCVALSFKKSSDRHQKSLDSEQIQNINDGQTVRVSRWKDDGSADVFFRGTHWSAKSAPGEPTKPGLWKIVGMDGNSLILKFEKEK